MDTTNAPSGKEPPRSSNDQPRTITDAGQLVSAQGREVTQWVSHECQSSRPSMAEPQNTPMLTTIASRPRLSGTAEVDNTYTLADASPLHSSRNKLHEIYGAGNPEVTQWVSHGRQSSQPSMAEPQNTPTLTTIASRPRLSGTAEVDNTYTLAGTIPLRSSSRNKLHELYGAGYPAALAPTLGNETFQGSSEYAYEGFPWTDEPQSAPMPSHSVAGSTLRTPRASDTHSKFDSETRLKISSSSMLTSAGRQGSSGYGNSGFSQDAERQNIPMQTPRPNPSRRFSEYSAMLLAMDKIPVG
jgi:hypothetical protein